MRLKGAKPIDHQRENSDSIETRQERRDRKLKKKREKMTQHGKGLSRVYRNALLKRLKKETPEK